MDLQPNDLHFCFSNAQNSLKGFDPEGEEIFSCEARNRTVREGYGHDGRCPLGTFHLGAPVPKGTVPFGPFFIPVVDYAGHHAMRDFGREGIGIHGGGSGLRDPFAPQQGWQVTEGCIRMMNHDLLALVALIRPLQKAGGTMYLTVE